MSLPSCIITSAATRSRIINKRRVNYLKLKEGLSDIRAVRPLFPNLQNDITPYMFPLIIDEPDIYFPLLKRLAMPIWRWDDIDTQVCNISLKYSHSLLQLPCHQELRDDELNWMIKCIHDVFSDHNIDKN